MSTKISRRDVLITILVLLIGFGGTPLFFLGVDRARARQDQRELQPIVEEVLNTWKTDMLHAAELAFTRTKLLDPRGLNFQWQSSTHNYQTNVSESTVYAPAIAALSQVCNQMSIDTERDSKEKFTLGYSSYYQTNCSFVTKMNGTYVEVGQNVVQEFEDLKDIEFIKLLDAGSPMSIHRDVRTFHVWTLLQENPLVVWQLRISLQND